MCAHPGTTHTRPDAPTAAALAADVRAGRTDPVALVEAALARIAECDGEVGAFVHVDAEGALREARERAGEAPRGPLHGVPVAVKDLFDVAGQVTRAGSQVPAGPPAERDAAAVARLRAAGAVVVGRTRTHEFAWGIHTQHVRLGGTANPWDTDRVPGGSSGGSAAAVAAGMVPLALGTDTGCSIRLPAAWCGLVGHKPTYGAVDLTGAVPLAPSLDHGGALVRDVADARLALEVLSGRRLPDPQPVDGLRTGVVEQTGRSGRPVVLPDGDRLAALYGVVQGAEALAWHRATGRWPAHADRYGPDVAALLQRCEQLTPVQVAAADRDRDALRLEVADLFEQVDVLLLPVATCGPSARADPSNARDGPLRGHVLPWTVLANLCGLPACSVPAGLDADGLPVGLQVLGPPGTDARVLDVAASLGGQLARVSTSPSG